jgi:hypothetical protein
MVPILAYAANRPAARGAVPDTMAQREFIETHKRAGQTTEPIEPTTA